MMTLPLTLSLRRRLLVKSSLWTRAATSISAGLGRPQTSFLATCRDGEGARMATAKRVQDQQPRFGTKQSTSLGQKDAIVNIPSDTNLTATLEMASSEFNSAGSQLDPSRQMQMVKQQNQNVNVFANYSSLYGHHQFRPVGHNILSCSRIMQQRPLSSRSSFGNLSGKRGGRVSLEPSVFVSRHNNSLEVSARDIVDQFHRLGGVDSNSSQTVRQTQSHVIVKECPFCAKPTKGKADNQYKLYVQIGSGAYFCHRCGAKGSWFDLKANMGGGAKGGATMSKMFGGGNEGGAFGAGSSGFKGSNTGSMGYGRERQVMSDRSHASSNPPLPMPPRRLQALWSSNLFKKDDIVAAEDGTDSKPIQLNPVFDYLTKVRGFTTKTLRKYGVGRGRYKFVNDSGKWQEADCVTFAWIMSVEDAQIQESLRGAVFEWEDYEKNGVNSSDPKNPKVNEDKSADNCEKTKSDAQKKGKNDPVDAAPEKEETSRQYVTRRIKARALENKAWQRLDPAGGAWGFFGFHTIPDDATEIVLTEGEYDAMAVSQATGRPAISLPNGCRSLPVEALPMLERFEKIYLWMDNDLPGQEGAEQFAKKIGLERSYIVRPSPSNAEVGPNEKLPKDANEALLQGLDLERIIADARLTPHDRIMQFEELRKDVMHEILFPDKYSGVPLPSFPKFTSIIKGLRRGELTVLTGPTGSGKTTFLSQMSLDLAEQSQNVLWGSFEIKNTRLMHKLLQQFAREPLPAGDPSQADKLDAIATRFTQLPFYFLKFHGGSDIDDVIDAMDYAVYVYDCQTIILDNMQFMISRNSGNSSWDKFDVQDMAIEKFRQFATNRNVHVVLVVHPRKEQEESKLSISSIYGSAKATQEADTVLILQAEGHGSARRKYIEVKKNRFNGDLGFAPLHFDPKSGRYTEEPLINGTKVHSAPPQFGNAAHPKKAAIQLTQGDVLP